MRKIDSDKQTEKKEVYIPPNINLEGIEESDLFDNQEDSGGSKSVVEGQDSNLPPSVKLTDTEEKLPELTCPFCGRKLIRYKQAWICGHGCTKPALKPIDDLEKDSRSEKELPNRETVFYEASYGINGKPNVLSSKLPELDCKDCKHSERYTGIWCYNIVGKCFHFEKFEPKEKTEPEKDYKREMKGVKYFSRWRAKEVLEKAKKDCDNRCQKLIEGFIKFIDRFEERYEGNKCGECLEYWKTIKEHYKGA